jgi:hypothetical protein
MSMTLDEASKHFGLPVTLLNEFVKDNKIDNPITPDDIDFLTVLQGLWGKAKWARFFYMGVPIRDRKAVTDKRVLSKVEKYIFNRYINLPKGERLSTDRVAVELFERFGLSLKKDLRGKIKEMRIKAKDKKRKSKANRE